ncbi:MAG: hypothetical protein JW854_03215 [Actinobacteria bacterium]|nr:hypothetical protein [Actinomycetota bacterium]
MQSISAADPYNAWAVGDAGTILHTSGGGKFTSHFAEGYTGPGFQEYLCLGNPDEVEVEATVTYIFTDGTSQQEQVTIPAQSRATLNVNASVGEGKEVSAHVNSDSHIVAERPMYFSYKGMWAGGHDAMGVTSPASTWYFAEGYTRSGFEEWICVLNPGDAAANLTFRFQTEEEGEKVVQGQAVPSHSRASFSANQLLGAGYQTSLKLESDQPVVAERPLYFDYSGLGDHHWCGGHCVMDASTLSDEYYFAEGTTRAGFEEWLCLQNPNSGPPSR